MRIRRISRVLAVTAVLPAAAAAAGIVTVSQQNRAFAVSNERITHGQTVRFNNDDQFRHQIYVESPSFNFESDEADPGTSVDILFAKAGVFQVRCHIHPKMLLTVDVN